MFVRAGKAISPDTVVTGKQAPAPADRLATLYDNTPNPDSERNTTWQPCRSYPPVATR